MKGLKGRPDIKPPSQPSGMEKANRPKAPAGLPRRGGGPKTAQRAIDEDRILEIPGLPPGSIFKGYQDYLVQELVFRKHVVRYRRERWLTPDGRELVAEMPAGVRGHFGADLRRFVLCQHHQGQVTSPRLLTQLLAIGIEISKRQLMRLLIADHAPFIEEARDVLRAGLLHASWVGVDDTGARHKGRNAVCTQIGNDSFAWFGTTYSKSRVNFLECLRAGFTDYVVNDEALAYMRKQNLPAALVARLAADGERSFADAEAWSAHLGRLGISELKTHPDPTQVATEGALLGAVLAHGFLAMAVILSDDAGQFNVLYHALCWVHAERLVHKLDAFNQAHRAAQQAVRGQIWDLYRDLIAYKSAPSHVAKVELEARFDAIFQQRTGFATLDQLLKRLRANKAELLVVLDRPEISAPQQRIGKHHPRLRDQAQGQRRNPKRSRPRLPRRLSRPPQDLQETGHQILGLSRGETESPQRDGRSQSARARQSDLRHGLTAVNSSSHYPKPLWERLSARQFISFARGFAPLTQKLQLFAVSSRACDREPSFRANTTAAASAGRNSHLSKGADAV